MHLIPEKLSIPVKNKYIVVYEDIIVSCFISKHNNNWIKMISQYIFYKYSYALSNCQKFNMDIYSNMYYI